MGTGITGGILLEFSFLDSSDKKDFLQHQYSTEFMKFYTEVYSEKNKKSSYVLNYPELLPQFKGFYTGLHEILDHQKRLTKMNCFGPEYDRIVSENDYDGFIEYFRTGVPYSDVPEPQIYKGHYFSTLYIDPYLYLNIYDGSYKAILEEYSTLNDMRNLLIKAYDHPLSKLMLFGIFG
jgi:hypothetical protein